MYYVSYELYDIYVPKKRPQYNSKTYYVYKSDGTFVGEFKGKQVMPVINLHSWFNFARIFEVCQNWYKDFYISMIPVTEIPSKKYTRRISIDVYTKYGDFIETLPTIKTVKEKYNVPSSKINNIQFGDKHFGDYIFKYNSK